MIVEVAGHKALEGPLKAPRPNWVPPIETAMATLASASTHRHNFSQWWTTLEELKSQAGLPAYGHVWPELENQREQDRYDQK